MAGLAFESSVRPMLSADTEASSSTSTSSTPLNTSSSNAPSLATPGTSPAPASSSGASLKSLSLEELKALGNARFGIRSASMGESTDQHMSERRRKSGSSAEILAASSCASLSVAAQYSEDVKLKAMSVYLDLVAKEVSAKALQWKHAFSNSSSVAGAFTGPASSSTPRGQRLAQITKESLNSERLSVLKGIDSLVDPTNAGLSEQALQILQIPHQKFGSEGFLLISEEQRASALHVERIRDTEEIRGLFGIFSSSSDAARSLSGGVAPYPMREGDISKLSESAAVSPRAVPSSKAGASRKPPPAPTETDPNSDRVPLRYVHPAARILARRIRALQIPPLPPHTGSLQQPSGADYNCYYSKLDMASAGEGASSPRPRCVCYLFPTDSPALMFASFFLLRTLHLYVCVYFFLITLSL